MAEYVLREVTVCDFIGYFEAILQTPYIVLTRKLKCAGSKLKLNGQRGGRLSNTSASARIVTELSGDGKTSKIC